VKRVGHPAAAVCGLRIGEVTALSSLDFPRKLIHITGSLDDATRKEGTPKTGPSAAPVRMPDLLTKDLHDRLEKTLQAELRRQPVHQFKRAGLLSFS
jgi:hypothetical protein